MNESGSILRYLAQKYPSLNQFYDGTLEHRQEIDAALDFNSTVYRPGMTSKIMPSFMKNVRNLDELPPALQAIWDAAPDRIKGSMDALEALLTRQATKFVNGDLPSIADFQLHAEFCDVFYMGMKFNEYPKITAWHEACRGVSGIKEINEEMDAGFHVFKEWLGL